MKMLKMLINKKKEDNLDGEEYSEKKRWRKIEGNN